ncbi:hypothetical protein KVR01_012177 [Diaporthe batatas]|uniref:uncharacterized protein n=1 Tax=Diaporthe batatas TaxID=748121 RepID=UPI001D03FD9F|nr:uncharacterized protein KVR01_012177 [Diaporthe batatas]KAG8157905.1 hypothetical protein KVR01_012177 [Diaporthe batatas]
MKGDIISVAVLKRKKEEDKQNSSRKVEISNELEVTDWKSLFEKHSHEFSSAITHDVRVSLESADMFSGDDILREARLRELRLLSQLCGYGRVILTGTPSINRLPSNLHAVVLRHVGTSDVQLDNSHNPLLTGSSFELIPDPALEIPYLWVDSLCILQDDAEDWRQEASEMGVIYSRSALTITTPYNSQCDQSLNAPNENQDDSSWPRLRWEHRRGEMTVTGSVTVRPRVAIPSGEPFPLSNGKKDSPWMTRGWTLQEWLLSPRVLHCGRERVWDCHETWHTESRMTWTSTSTSPLNDNKILRDGLSSHIVARMSRLDPETRKGGFDTHWARVVEDFTSRTLSCEMDKMPAIAGLAKKFMEHAHVKAPDAIYLAGLWYYKGVNPFRGGAHPISQIPLGLLWRRSGAGFMRSPAAYRAPSWSWAALDGPVELFRVQWPLISTSDNKNAFKVINLLKVEAANCFFDPPESLSLVQTAWIIASGHLEQAYTYAHAPQDAATIHSGYANDYRQTFVVLYTHPSHEKAYWTGIFDESLETTGINYVEGSLYLLHVATIIHKLDDGHVLELLNHALLVEMVGSFDHLRCFRRLGVAWNSSHRMGREADSISRPATEWSDRHMLKDWETDRVRLI